MSDYEIFVKLLKKSKKDFTISKNFTEILVRIIGYDDSIDFYFDPITEEIHENLT